MAGRNTPYMAGRKTPYMVRRTTAAESERFGKSAVREGAKVKEEELGARGRGQMCGGGVSVQMALNR